eukprot:3196486-Lingulodinium_polyedra.AAC.1
MTGTPFAGGDVDIRKRFGQLVRPLAVALAAAADVPTGVLRAYSRFMDGLALRLCLVNGLGAAESHRRGVPST